MPGLLRGVARTAVVAGTATAVSGRVQRRQAAKFADRDAHTAADRSRAYEQDIAAQEPEYADAAEPPAAPEPAKDMITQLRELAALKEDGILTEEEFAAQKARLLA
ncbi:SHOCT domain-containing protein [Arthrobacter sp. SX1312]|uniref:SHOCT domain-containing protein n=1 Tax=Arthrobacter sp. SX1312 TaxID=2058896 RepID=UPI000CE2C4D3|nr:SHOCT domain-containing protein [Arthrobacter sp. SX1312]